MAQPPTVRVKSTDIHREVVTGVEPSTEIRRRCALL
jgi:hypothetical protein